MENKSASWQERFSLTTCSAQTVGSVIAPTALGVAVIYERAGAGEKIFLVIESRASSLRAQCAKRLETAKLPSAAALTVAFHEQILPDASSEAVQAACREQVALASELRRELRPAMR